MMNNKIPISDSESLCLAETSLLLRTFADLVSFRVTGCLLGLVSVSLPEATRVVLLLAGEPLL